MTATGEAKSVTAEAAAGVGSPTKVLSSFAATLGGKDLPASVVDTLGDLLLDYLRVGSIGANMEWSDWARHYVAGLKRQGTAPVLFSETGCDPVGSAFLNTTFAGSIDADDTHVGSMLHPGSIVFSSALAVCGESSGSEFLGAAVEVRFGGQRRGCAVHRKARDQSFCLGSTADKYR